MSQHDEQLERLIAKSLDGEISPAEQPDLDQHLHANAAPRTRFDEIQAFLHAEARALDDREWDAWLAFYHKDCPFWMPAW